MLTKEQVEDYRKFYNIKPENTKQTVFICNYCGKEITENRIRLVQNFISKQGGYGGKMNS